MMERAGKLLTYEHWGMDQKKVSNAADLGMGAGGRKGKQAHMAEEVEVGRKSELGT